jgi:Tol biopolymer transport system component
MPVWLPDGLKKAYAHQNNGGVGLDIWVMNAETLFLQKRLQIVIVTTTPTLTFKVL